MTKETWRWIKGSLKVQGWWTLWAPGGTDAFGWTLVQYGGDDNKKHGQMPLRQSRRKNIDAPCSHKRSLGCKGSYRTCPDVWNESLEAGMCAEAWRRWLRLPSPAAGTSQCLRSLLRSAVVNSPATSKQGDASKGHPLHHPQAYAAHLPSHWCHFAEKTVEWGRPLKAWPLSQRDQTQKLNKEVNSGCKRGFLNQKTLSYFWLTGINSWDPKVSVWVLEEKWLAW